MHRGTAAAVYEVDRELAVMVAAGNFPCRVPDRCGDLFIKDTAGCVGRRRRRLNMAKCGDQLRPLTDSLARHAEVAQSPRGVRAEESIGGDRHLAQGVPLAAESCDGVLSQLTILVSIAFLVRTRNDTVGL